MPIANRQLSTRQESITREPTPIDAFTEPGVWVSYTARPFDLPAFRQERMIAESLELYRRNPLAFAAIETIKNFIVGSPIKLEAEPPEVFDVLMRHWLDPANNWPALLPERIKTLLLTGELLLTTQETPDGRILIGSISPAFIDRLILDPINQEKVLGIRLKPSVNLLGLPTIPLDWQVIDYSPQTGRLEGNLFFFRINVLPATSRGMSILYPVSYWLYRLDDFLADQLNRIFFEGSFFWKITLKGKTEADVDRFIREGRAKPPQRGGAFVTTDAVDIEPLIPKFQAEDIHEIFRTYQALIYGGLGLPAHFFSEPGTAGRAVLAEMNEPAFRNLSARQEEIKRMLELIFRFVLERSRDPLPPPEERRFRILMPKISLRDLQRTSGALLRATQSLRISLEDGIINKEQAREVYYALVDQLGMGIDLRTISPALEIEKTTVQEKREKKSRLDLLTGRILQEIDLEETLELFEENPWEKK